MFSLSGPAGSSPAAVRRPEGAFSMVELLTLLAVVGVAATLAASTVARAAARTRQVQCVDNLRQVAVATELYSKETLKRPRSLSQLAARSNPLDRGRRILCPSDRLHPAPAEVPGGPTNRLLGWGNRANASQQPTWVLQQRDPDGQTFDQEFRETAEPLEFSYLHPFAWRRAAWMRLAGNGPQAGLAVCQLHGIALRKEAQGTASHLDYEGRTLRVQQDGEVVQRRVLRPEGPSPAAGFGRGDPQEDYPWDLYLDLPAAPARL